METMCKLYLELSNIVPHSCISARELRLRQALERIANCGQSIEPDHWKFRKMARDEADRALQPELE